MRGVRRGDLLSAVASCALAALTCVASFAACLRSGATNRNHTAASSASVEMPIRTRRSRVGHCPAPVVLATFTVAALVTGTVGSGSKVIWTVKAGLPAPQRPSLEEAPAPELLDTVELCRVTLWTPSIRRSRCSVRATC